MAFATAVQLEDVWKRFGAVAAVRGAAEVGRSHALVDGQRRYQPGGARSGPGQLSGIRRLARTRMLCSMVEASGASLAQRRYSLKASMALRYSPVWW